VGTFLIRSYRKWRHKQETAASSKLKFLYNKYKEEAKEGKTKTIIMAYKRKHHDIIKMAKVNLTSSTVDRSTNTTKILWNIINGEG
jgi:hypothetical protein